MTADRDVDDCGVPAVLAFGRVLDVLAFGRVRDVSWTRHDACWSPDLSAPDVSLRETGSHDFDCHASKGVVDISLRNRIVFIRLCGP